MCVSLEQYSSPPSNPEMYIVEIEKKSKIIKDAKAFHLFSMLLYSIHSFIRYEKIWKKRGKITKNGRKEEVDFS